MKVLEKLWNEYLADECAAMNDENERALVKEAAEKHEGLNERLTEEERGAMEEYVDVLCEIHGFFARKAFFKGCEFTAAFLMEAFPFH